MGLGAAATVAAGALMWLSFGPITRDHAPAYTVARVIDGDTFETTDKLKIRLSSADAPEMTRCGGPEAKAALERLISGKQVYLRVVFIDTYRRLVAMVYTDTINVNVAMLHQGYSYYSRGTPGFDELLQHAIASARANHLGIHSESCTQWVNKTHPNCTIKGNISTRGQIYYAPTCGIYPVVAVQLYQGDQWFCTEKEAEKAGFRKAVQCQ